MAKNFHIKKKDGVWQVTYRPISTFRGIILYEETAYATTLKGILAQVRILQRLPTNPIHTLYKSLIGG